MSSEQADDVPDDNTSPEQQRTEAEQQQTEAVSPKKEYHCELHIDSPHVAATERR
jgi:hypothetical protein